MFRQLLSAHLSDPEQNLHEDLFFPNLNQLIKAEPINLQKNLKFTIFAKINHITHSLEMSFDFLEQFKNQKIKFVTKLQQSSDSHPHIEISSAPIHVDNGCNYFFLSAYWSFQKQAPSTGAKSRGASHGFSQNKHNPKNKQRHLPIKQVFFNLIYLISSVIYVRSQIVNEFLNGIKSQNKNCYQHKNVLKVIRFQTIGKKADTRLSTAAQTKFHNQMIQSDIFQEQFTTQRNRTQQSSLSNTLSPKNYLIQGKKNYLLNLTSLNQLKDKLFTRASIVQLSHQNYKQAILQQTCNINESCHQQFILTSSLEQLYTKLSQQRHLMSIQQFIQINQSNIVQASVNKILVNYENAIELQFDQMDERSIDQIKGLLKALFDKTLLQFYEECQKFSNPQLETQFANKLLTKIYETEKKLFQNINKGKKELLNRRISFYDDQCYLQKSLVQHETKFQSLLGQRAITDQQVGFGLYRESLQQKMADIFGQLIGEKQKKMNSKTRKGRFMTKNQFTTNLQHRIQILVSQKRNIEQSLHFEQRLQENLVEYLKGLQTRPLSKRQIQTVSESSEEVD